MSDKGALDFCRTPEEAAFFERECLAARCELLESALAQRDARIAELAEALRLALTLCRCRGTGLYRPPCSMCHDSTWDHACDDAEIACTRCEALRAALGGAK